MYHVGRKIEWKEQKKWHKNLLNGFNEHVCRNENWKIIKKMTFWIWRLNTPWWIPSSIFGFSLRLKTELFWAGTLDSRMYHIDCWLYYLNTHNSRTESYLKVLLSNDQKWIELMTDMFVCLLVLAGWIWILIIWGTSIVKKLWIITSSSYLSIREGFDLTNSFTGPLI